MSEVIYKVHIDTDFPVASFEEEISFDSSVFEGKTEEEIDDIVRKEALDIMWNYIELWWEPKEEAPDESN